MILQSLKNLENLRDIEALRVSPVSDSWAGLVALGWGAFGKVADAVDVAGAVAFDSLVAAEVWEVALPGLAVWCCRLAAAMRLVQAPKSVQSPAGPRETSKANQCYIRVYTYHRVHLRCQARVNLNQDMTSERYEPACDHHFATHKWPL